MQVRVANQRLTQSCSGVVIRIRQGLDAQALRELGRFRHAVYQAQGVIIPQDELDEDGGWTDALDVDPETVHILAYCEGVLAASGRLSLHGSIESLPDAFPFGKEVDQFPGPYASLNRLVVDPAHRGKGLAALIVRFRLDLAQQLGAKAIISCAIGENRRMFFESLGFRTLQAMKDPSWDLGSTLVYKVIKKI